MPASASSPAAPQSPTLIALVKSRTQLSLLVRISLVRNFNVGHLWLTAYPRPLHSPCFVVRRIASRDARSVSTAKPRQAFRAVVRLGGLAMLVGWLTKTNTALSKPAIATTDAVLVSVLLLSLYETIICADAGTPENWIKHTRGALALIQLRGRRQLDTLVGRALFTQVANIICVDSLRSGTRLAPDLVELQTAALRYIDECPRFGMSSSTGELANLLADVKGGYLTPLGVVDATQRLEAKYIAYVSNLPASWQYEVEELKEPQADVYGTTVHHYSSNRVAQFWNSYRMTRIFLNGVRHGHARYLRPPNENLLAQSEHAAMEMASDICASVPQFTDPKTCPLHLLRLCYGLCRRCEVRTWSGTKYERTLRED